MKTIIKLIAVVLLINFSSCTKESLPEPSITLLKKPPIFHYPLVEKDHSSYEKARINVRWNI